jgi:hypothetical protein
VKPPAWPSDEQWAELLASMPDAGSVDVPRPVRNRAYQRAHYRRDPQRVIRYQRQHYQEHRERILDQQAAYRERNAAAERESKRDYYRRNKPYVDAANARRRRKVEAEVRPRHYSTWTEAEDALVMRADLTVNEIARMLQRSRYAVTGRRHLLRRPSRYGGSVTGGRWTPAEDAVVMSNRAIDDIAGELGRSYAAVVARRGRIRCGAAS